MLVILILQCHLEGDWVLCWKDGPKTFGRVILGMNEYWEHQWSGYIILPEFCRPHSKMFLQKLNCFPAQDHYFIGQASKITFFSQASEILTQWMGL